jgi:hypothetical protein
VLKSKGLVELQTRLLMWSGGQPISIFHRIWTGEFSVIFVGFPNSNFGGSRVKKSSTPGHMPGLLKKASEHAIASAIKNSSSPKANKKRGSMSQRTSE